jgi:hypothetical protein
MSTFRRELLPKLQDGFDCGGGAGLFRVQKATFDALEVRADAADATALGFLGRLVDAARKINGPDDHERWNGFIEIYQEAVFYIIARERKIMLKSIPTREFSTPDFECVEPKPAWFEVKTINVRGGVPVQDATLIDGLRAKYEAIDDAKSGGVGYGTQAVTPHGIGATHVDAVRQVIDKLAGAVKSKQLSKFPTYLIVSLDRVGLPISEKPLSQSYKSSDGEDLSGDLWHIAAGEVVHRFSYADQTLPTPASYELKREGLLRQFPKIAGVIFVQTVWSELPDMDAAFRSRAYRLYGVRRADTADVHTHFDRLCDHLVEV